MSRRPRYPNPPRREDGRPSGWDRYLDLLIRNHVPETARQWYVTRAREFIDGMRPDRLSDMALDDITGYFRKVSDEDRLNLWQFRQMVEAVQLLVVDLAHVKCGNSVDWDYWKEALQTLPPDHPTLAREQSPEESVERLSSGPRFAASGEAHPILTELTRTLRTRQYSIRTEQAYVSWCHKFLLFCAPKSVEELDESDVQRYLSHLAIDRNVAANTQSLAFNAVAFLYREVLQRRLDDIQFARVRRPRRLPVVLTPDEVSALLGQMEGVYKLT